MQTTEPISVFIIDCGDRTVEPLSQLFSGSHAIKVIGQSAGDDRAAAAVPSDVIAVLVDEAHSAVLDTALRAFPSKTTIVVARAYSEDISTMIERGVRGIAVRPISPERLHQAILSVAHGDLWIDHSLLLRHHLRITTKQEDATTASAGTPKLTEREHHILQMVARGCSNRQIAGELFLSISTIKISLGKVLEKLHAADRTEAVVQAMKRGLI